MHGRETVRRWIVPIMDKYRELYTGYEWHVVDAERGRVVFYVQNRRDHPSGKGTIDFPGVSIIEYAGNGKWKREEDYWAVKGREVAMKEYEEACRTYDPEHPKKHTRSFWGTGPAWIPTSLSFHAARASGRSRATPTSSPRAAIPGRSSLARGPTSATCPWTWRSSSAR